MTATANTSNADGNTPTDASHWDASHWQQRYVQVRAFSEQLCEPLTIEDMVVQSMPDVSPSKWHLAHTSWFFETFILHPCLPEYHSPDAHYAVLFNSYYNGIGEQFPRPRRGLLSRPTVAQIRDYRRHVDQHIYRLLAEADSTTLARITPLLELGLQHEQQHQELLLTDIKHVFFQTPLRPAYQHNTSPADKAPALAWHNRHPREVTIGHQGEGFAFDNEGPVHQALLAPFALASRPVTNGEYLAFIEDGGYQRPEFWLSEGWMTIQAQNWHAPLYWEQHKGAWQEFTLSGMQPLQLDAPVCHVSYFEAEAFAHWSSQQLAGVRLPTEFEWEAMAQPQPITGNFVEQGILHPAAPSSAPAGPLQQLYGDVWEWTASAYAPYPAYQIPDGAIGEYNGKFMCNQYVLRGGSCASAQSHLRPSYRNFFPPHARWQFSGIRLARSL